MADFFLSMIPTSFVEPFVKGDTSRFCSSPCRWVGAVDMDVGNTELPAGFVETDETRGWDVNNELEMQPAS